MFSIVFSNLIANPQRMESLDRLAEDQITVRGYNLSRVIVPPELKRREWFLPVNLIVGEYCPTGRYLYLTKIKEEKPQLTWAMFQGREIDELYKSLFNTFHVYTTSTDPKELYIKEELEKFQDQFYGKVRKDIEGKMDSFVQVPSPEDIQRFLENIKKLIRYETQLCSSIIDFVISMKLDINLKSEVALLFPFNFKAKINALDLGFSEGIEPDFIFAEEVMGDIKTGEWRDFFKLTTAAYALAYENEHRRNMNLGVIVNPVFLEKRTVPVYPNSLVDIIEDSYRNAVIVLRNKKLRMIKGAKDPGLPEDKTPCYSCGYIDRCLGKIT